MARGPLDGPAPALKASLIRDTVVMPGLTYLTVRYIVDSPGVWCVLRLDGCLAVGKVRGWVGVASSAGTPLTSLTPWPPPPPPRLVHCHIDWHLVAGLGWVFRAGV